MRGRRLAILIAASALAGGACAPSEDPVGSGTGGSSTTGHGGSGASGGSGAAGNVGTTGAAGTTTGSGGAAGSVSTTGSAGTTGTAGVTGAGGAAGRGGTTGAGGMAGMAGNTGTAGNAGRGGGGGTSGGAGAGGRGGTTGAGGMAGSSAGRGGTTGQGGSGGQGNLPAGVTSLFPPPNGQNLCPDPPLKITFDGAATLGSTGRIRVFTSGGSAVATVDMAASTITETIGGMSFAVSRPVYVDGNTVSVTLPPKALAYGMTYYVN